MLSQLLLSLIAFAPPAGDVPVSVTAEIVDPCHAEPGTIQISLRFIPKRELKTDYKLRIGLDLWSGEVLKEDLSFDSPTSTWERGKAMKLIYERAIPPELNATLEEDIVVLLGFLDPETGEVEGPRGLPSGSDG